MIFFNWHFHRSFYDKILKINFGKLSRKRRTTFQTWSCERQIWYPWGSKINYENWHTRFFEAGAEFLWLTFCECRYIYIKNLFYLFYRKDCFDRQNCSFRYFLAHYVTRWCEITSFWVVSDTYTIATVNGQLLTARNGQTVSVISTVKYQKPLQIIIWTKIVEHNPGNFVHHYRQSFGKKQNGDDGRGKSPCA